MSRAVEQRSDKKPILSDLRESGSIEQDADIVMLIYREEYYLSRSEPHPDSMEYEEWFTKQNKCYNTAEIIVAKHRNGPVGTVNLHYDNRYSKFGNIVKNSQQG
ncbi:dnaB-like helicase C terminal domain protein [Orientia tsutsugamushi str. Kato PP]|nr:dnaB-like helicase C terminal domain protein [Orientia tsutsugamushi str. Kato PP]